MSEEELKQTHWVVMQHSHFTGLNWIAERRKTREGAYKALHSLERYADSEHYMFDVMRSDVAEKQLAISKYS